MRPLEVAKFDRNDTSGGQRRRFRNAIGVVRRQDSQKARINSAPFVVANVVADAAVCSVCTAAADHGLETMSEAQKTFYELLHE